MKNVLLFFALVMSATAFSQQDPGLKLWYNQPSGETWEDALPVGNGRLGGMVYGNVDTEIIQLNEHTVWSGSPNRNDNPDALAALPEIRRLIFDGRQKEAEMLASKTIQTKRSNGQMFLPVGSLLLSFEGHDNYTHYRRELDIEQALVKCSYLVNGVTFEREVLTSIPDEVIVIHLTASKAGAISFSTHLSSPNPNAQVKIGAAKDLIISGTTVDHEGVKGMVRFTGIVRIKSDGGTLSSKGSELVLRNANSASIYISIATNFKNYQDISGDENGRAEDYMDGAFKKSYAALRKNHIAAYQKYFNRVKLDLGKTDAAKLPTDERLKNFRSVNDPQFVVLYYQFGRYLLISSSRPGGQPANLQGIWNHSMQPPWDSKYTININAQMNYWPAEKTNLAELHEPFLRMVKEMSEAGRETARIMYGARGWMAHHNTDIWRITGPVDPIFWGIWSAGGAWTSQHLWEHYLYNGDKSYLESVYPILKGAATFYVDYLVEHPKYKWLVVCPGTSPENAPQAHEGSSLDAGTTMDNQIVFDAFSTAISAAQVLKKDEAFVDTLIRMRGKLPPMHIGRHGQLQEWLEDIDDPNDHHRHISHLYGLFPSNQISPYRTPELYSAAKNTLLQRGDVSTGWSMGWKINWWARMLDGNHAYKMIQNQLSPLGATSGGGTYNNLFDAHPPFQIDGNFGCTSGITEMLMQSADGVIFLIPALPDVWTAGSVSGLRARGGFEIASLEWKDGSVVKVVIKSSLGGMMRVRAPNRLRFANGEKLVTATGENANIFYQTVKTPVPIVSAEATITPAQLRETFVYDIPTSEGMTYTLVALE